MQGKDYLRWYARSPLGIGSLFGGLGGCIVLAAVGFPLVLSLLAGLGIIAAFSLVGLFTGLGPRQVVSALDAGKDAEGHRRLAEASAVRERIARLRIADPKVSEAAGLAILAAGEYLEAGRKESKDDPLADAALGDCLDIVDIYLKEVDEASVEKRYRLEDADPFVQARQRTVAALREKAAFLRERRIQIDGGLPAVDRMEIREELK
ncbi:MAG: hypothetical protein NT061_04285 [Spirochaetes bacterium]|nr:hypothetical protein [Spirochaetota bacterium]